MQAEQHQSTEENLGTVKYVQTLSFLFTGRSKAVVRMVFDFHINK